MPMSVRNTVKFNLDPNHPTPPTAQQRKRLKRVAAMPDDEIDYSDIPRQTGAVQWTIRFPLRPGLRDRRTAPSSGRSGSSVLSRPFHPQSSTKGSGSPECQCASACRWDDAYLDESGIYTVPAEWAPKADGFGDRLPTQFF